MKPSIQKLQKYLKLEAERGYDNRAIVGGLDRMLGPWEAEARVEGVPEELIQAVNARLRDYPRLSPSSRAETLEGLWRRLQRETKKTLPPLAPPASEKPAGDPQTSPNSTGQNAREKETLPAEYSHPEKGETAGEGQNISEPADPTTLTSQPGEPRPSKTRQDAPEEQHTALNAPITVLPGVGPRHAQTLGRLNLVTLKDMLYYFPRRYDDYTQLKPINRLFYGEEVTVIASIQSATARPIRGGHTQVVEAIVSDGTGSLRVTWFNQPWIAKRLHAGLAVVLSGKIDQYLGRLVMNSPEWEPLEQQNLHTNRIVPVYALTANIKQRWLRRLLHQVVTYWSPRVADHLPDWILQDAGLMDLPDALLEIHFPNSWETLKAARHRLAFDEIFLLQLGVLRQKRTWQSRTARAFQTTDEWLEERLNKLPFSLTGAQKAALQDIRENLASGRPMNRLLQGDVGSGKTVIAALGIAVLAGEGSQTAFMAPTSILAEQHYASLLKLLAPQDGGADSILEASQIRLMIGATPEAEKREIRQALQSGEVKLVIGTHALIEDPVTFSDLQLVIVDEQHRFGVEQRAVLRSKGSNPHLLVMTATPIPRSLALTVYGDLDLSVMDEMPPGRQVIETHVLFPRERERAYSLIRGQLDLGRQAFVIYPLVEENENSDTLAAVSESERLQAQVLPKYKVGLLHGRMKPDEKEETMTRFRDGEIQILVSTSVVEVGVDVPNATVMLIEGANRFGLAQLHQFRGRVGRGQEKSYCVLIPETADAVENERLQAMAETNDGFVLAERDLEQRGPGQFLGTRQSGFAAGNELRLARLTDVHLIEKARRHAQALFEADPELQDPQHQLLASTLQQFWGDAQNNTKGDIS
jgi:ATP-dependent DNA helicase RecG